MLLVCAFFTPRVCRSSMRCVQHVFYSMLRLVCDHDEVGVKPLQVSIACDRTAACLGPACSIRPGVCSRGHVFR